MLREKKGSKKLWLSRSVIGMGAGRGLNSDGERSEESGCRDFQFSDRCGVRLAPILSKVQPEVRDYTFASEGI